MRSLLPLLLVVVAVVSYFVLSGGFGIFQAIPWPHLLLAVAGAGWAIARAASLRRILPILVAMLSVALTGGYFWYTLSYSAYESTGGAEVGQRVAALATLELPSHAGARTAVLGEPATLLVLYRGFW
ncbi:MAG: hypothetical protein AAGF23_16190 [Acidobacteriota bacterium]